MIGSAIWTILYGIIEGVTEWLPISSTGHLIIFENLWQINNDIFTTNFLEFFRVVIQLGAILAVFISYIRRLNPFSKKLTPKGKKRVWNNWLRIVVGCIPAGFVGIFFGDAIDIVFYNWQTVAVTLIAYGIGFLICEGLHKNKNEKYLSMEAIPLKIAFAIGLAQVLALIPGTSRSGVTIIAGLLLGCSRVAVMDFTFCMAIPIMAGASGIKFLKYIFTGNTFSISQIAILLLGLIVAYIVSMLAVKFITGFVRKHTFKIFGYYRIVLGILVIVLGFFTPVFGNNSVYGLPSYVDEQYIDVNKFSRPDIALNEVKNIVIHYTANPGSSAQNNRDYFNSLANQADDDNATYASSNFVVGIEGEIIAVVPIDEIAYCSNSRNNDSISIETCHLDENGEFTDETYNSLVMITAWLCNHFGLSSEDVIRHYDITGKLCPLYFVNNEDAWVEFKADVQTQINTLESEANN